MAVEVEMTDDIRKYEPKTFGPFTTRQTVCLFIALAYSIPVGLFVPTSIDNKILIIIVVALPTIMAGYLKMDGANFEVLVLRLLYFKILAPGRRRYKSYNTFRAAMSQMEKKMERKQLARMSESSRKDYLDRKKQKKVVRYSRKKDFKIYM